MLVAGSSIELGAQNVHWENAGAFTGEISPAMLTELGVSSVIIGHSERRSLFGESDDSAVERALAAQNAGLLAVFCIGESLEQRDRGDTFAILEQQTARLGSLDPSRLVLAYEPVWAIGTGRNATAAQAEEAHAYLRLRIASLFDGDAAEAMRILYGGSLKSDNARELLSLEDVDGGLIGGASLDVRSFSAIIRAAAECAAGDDS
jgi:triosephosphate isomerase